MRLKINEIVGNSWDDGMETKKRQILAKSGENLAVFRQKLPIFTKMYFLENRVFRISSAENTAIGLKFGHNVQKDKGIAQ